MAGAYWYPQLVPLAKSYHVVAPDLPGHGANRASSFTYDGAIEAILSAIRSCAGGVAVLVGHSLGGYLAIDVAAYQPQLCRGLVLAGCTAIAQGPKAWLYAGISKLVPLMSEAVLTRWNNRLLRRLYPPDVVEPQIAAGYGFGAIGQSWRAVLGHNHVPALGGFRGPVLLINGARDRLFRSNEQQFLRSCKNGALKVLPGAGHLSNYDQPVAFTRAVRDFMESLPSVAAKSQL